jgi:hypothetical protein
MMEDIFPALVTLSPMGRWNPLEPIRRQTELLQHPSR